MSPVVEALRGLPGLAVLVVRTGQHGELLDQHLAELGLVADVTVPIGRAGGLGRRLARLVVGIGRALRAQRPVDLMLVQGDTTTALAGALAAFYAGVPVGHVEAGLRTSRPDRPFPEEMHRRLIARLARLHFAPTAGAVRNLVAEGVPPETVWLTGNPVVDALRGVSARGEDPETRELLEAVGPRRLVLVTCHRREAWGQPVRALARALRRLAEQRRDLAVLWPVHPSPAVARTVRREVGRGPDNLVLVPPPPARVFAALLRRADLVVTDSGGVIEEAATLGRRLLIVRDETERPEAVEAGRAELVPLERLGDLGALVERALEEPDEPGWWTGFGDGQAAARIARVVTEVLAAPERAGRPRGRSWGSGGRDDLCPGVTVPAAAPAGTAGPPGAARVSPAVAPPRGE